MKRTHGDMGLSRGTEVTWLLLLLCCHVQKSFSAIDTITRNQFMRDPENLVSNGRVFKLGFFSPPGSTDRYVGISYNNVSVPRFVWVANRERPLKDSSGVVTVSEDGNLVVLDGKGDILWSSNVTNSSPSSTVQLLDSGNLVLGEVIGNNSGSDGRIMWESFRHPGDTFLQNMKVTNKVKTGDMQLLTSWKSQSDPSKGSFSAGIDSQNIPEVFIWNGSRPYWRSGQWNGRVFLGIPSMDSVFLNGFNIVHEGANMYLTYVAANQSFLFDYVLDFQGVLLETYWDEGKQDWEVNWSSMQSNCDVYGWCGPFGSCNSQDAPMCSCLSGYEPKYIEEWKRENWTSGCVRRTPLQCEKISSRGDKVGNEDGFLELSMLKAPHFAEWSPASEEECRLQCLKNCSCVAYAFYIGIGCMSWNGNLIDIQKFSVGGTVLFIRVAYSDLEKKRSFKVIIAVTLTIGMLVIAICTYISARWMKKQREKEKSKEMLLFDKGEGGSYYSNEIIRGDGISQAKLQELPLFNFQRLANATDNFNVAYKLGQGGFGPVYRGKLQNGQDIAVKRLSRASGQGIEEFMNEVVVISRLQHRNLVKLLGCCVEGDEMMLIYEYMPNKSLDAFLFDPIKQKLLDWKKRLNIIEGIGRGLMYLHRDSRLRIIHRDLKASNILLDNELNPKISDFGMARIFGGNQDQAKTRRVVGTYGYMSPEYAMQGRFSEKSDVFSFGVLLLEIVSGRKNSSFHQDEKSLNLLEYAWKLWNEDDNIAALIDPTISEPCFETEILKCIQVGLLCVQEFARDRPNISTVISMVTSEIADLPKPKQPAFTGRNVSSRTESSPPGENSIHSVTLTVLEGR